jgi:hypothetical protein
MAKRTSDGRLIPLSKDCQLKPAESAFRIWYIELPGRYSLNDALEPALWRSVELFLRERGEKHCPRASDLIRITAADGDAIFKIEAVDRGYRLSLYCGQMATQEAS